MSSIPEADNVLREYVFPIELGMLLTFADAIGDVQLVEKIKQAVNDPSVEVIAPPTFLQVAAHFDPEYHLRPSSGAAPWFGSASKPTSNPEEARLRAETLHAEQHFQFMRPIMAGQTLCVRVREGSSWTKSKRSGGSLRFAEVIQEFYDEEQLVAISRRVAVRVEETK